MGVMWNLKSQMGINIRFSWNWVFSFKMCFCHKWACVVVLTLTFDGNYFKITRLLYGKDDKNTSDILRLIMRYCFQNFHQKVEILLLPTDPWPSWSEVAVSKCTQSVWSEWSEMEVGCWFIALLSPCLRTHKQEGNGDRQLGWKQPWKLPVTFWFLCSRTALISPHYSLLSFTALKGGQVKTSWQPRSRRRGDSNTVNVKTLFGL